MQKYVLIKLLEPLAEDTEFSAKNWPLHITIAANFVVDWDSTNLFEKLTVLLTSQKPFELTAGDDEYFGEQKQIQVTLLNMNDEIKSLHNNIVGLLRNVGATFDEPHYLEQNFRAHATVQAHTRLKKGDVVKIDSMTIVDMFPQGNINQRKIMRTVRLANS